MSEPLYRKPSDVETRWITFENPLGARGAGGQRNKGAKGHAWEKIHAGQTVTLMDADGSGTIRRFWATWRERDPEMLRSLVLRIYWDGATTPAVNVPFGDFFCAPLGRLVAFESELFASPEGRSVNCYIPMPFRNGARITVTNESNRDVSQLYYEIDCLIEPHDDDSLYFHASWRRERWTTLGEDFTILPKISGTGRFLGAHLGMIAHPANYGWWGEGEVKIYLDGDAEYPTLVNTGTEDYVGSGWGQSEFHQRYHGSLIIDDEKGLYAFYRHHVPDPVYFHQDIRVTIQQMGGAEKSKVMMLQRKRAEVQPVTIDTPEQFYRLLEDGEPIDLHTHPAAEDGWTNMYRRDDWSATALFYLDRPENGLPDLAPVQKRIEAIAGNNGDP